MAWFFLIFFSLYAFLHYYLYRRLRKVTAFFSAPVRIIVTVLFFHFSLSYIVARSLLRNYDFPFYDFFLYSGAMWFAFLLYGVLGLIVTDLTRTILKRTAWYRTKVVPEYAAWARMSFGAILLFTSVCVSYGFYNAHNIQLKTVEVALPKKSGTLQQLSILFFADSHFTPMNNADLARTIADISKKISPDLILMAGDIVDDQNHHLRRHKIAEELFQMKSNYGIFAAPGNHEYIVGVDSALSYLTQSGITVLRDSGTVIAGSVRIVGRDDSSRYRVIGSHRKALASLVSKNDSLPVILLDHQPFRIKEVAQSGVNLQLSGHTHHGQMFPFNLITSLIYEVSYGYKQIGNYGIYVTSGVGTWGPPVRLGSPAEVVLLKISFK